MNWVDLLAIGLATAGLVDTWFNGSVFANARAEVDDWDHVFWEVLRCPFCMVRQVPFWLVGLYVLSLMAAHNGFNCLAIVAKCPIYALAAGEIAWLLNIRRGDVYGYERRMRTVTDDVSRRVDNQGNEADDRPDSG